MIIENGLYTIYILINKVNNKIYIGTTKQKLSQRFRRGWGYKNQKLFYEDIQKYGWDVFECDVFASKLTSDEAFNMEQILIKKYRDQDPDMLYNRDAGGKHGKHCENTKETIRKLNIGRVITEEAKEKIRAARAKQVFSQEALAKRGEKMRGRKMSPEFCKHIGETHRKSVRCLENNKEYLSMKDAALDLGVSVSGISQQIKGIYENVKGYHFERI